MWNLSYGAGLLAVLALLGLLSLIELSRGQGACIRWRSALVIFAATLLGGLFGAATDWVFGDIPQDFRLLPTPLSMSNWLTDPWPLGPMMGSFAGLIAGGLIANAAYRLRPLEEKDDRSMPTLALPTVLREFWLPGVATVLAALVCILGTWAAPALTGQSDPIAYKLAQHPIGLKIAIAYAAHIGIYAGVTIGTILACFRIAEQRPQSTWLEPAGTVALDEGLEVLE